MFSLRRFEYNLQTMQRIKINDYFEFSEEICLEKFT